MNNNMSLSDKYKQEAKRNADLKKSMAGLLKRLADKDRLIIQLDKVVDEARIEIMGLKEVIKSKLTEK